MQPPNSQRSSSTTTTSQPQRTQHDADHIRLHHRHNVVGGLLRQGPHAVRVGARVAAAQGGAGGCTHAQQRALRRMQGGDTWLWCPRWYGGASAQGGRGVCSTRLAWLGWLAKPASLIAWASGPRQGQIGPPAAAPASPACAAPAVSSPPAPVCAGQRWRGRRVQRVQRSALASGWPSSAPRQSKDDAGPRSGAGERGHARAGTRCAAVRCLRRSAQRLGAPAPAPPAPPPQRSCACPGV